MMADDVIGQADISMRCTPIGRAIHRFLLEEMQRPFRPGYVAIARSLLPGLAIDGIDVEAA